MRSICSCVADALLKQPQPLAPRTGGRSGSRGSRDRRRRRSRPCPSPRRPRAASSTHSVRALLGANHLEQRHQRRRVEEVHADHVLGSRRRARERCHRDRRRVGGQHASSGRTPRTAPRTGRASGPRARAPPRSRGRRAASSSSDGTRLEQADRVLADPPLLDPLRKAAAHPLRAALECLRRPGRGAACASRRPRRAARCRRPSCRRPPRRARSLPAELRLALLEEGVHSLHAILGGHGQLVQAPLVVEARGHRGLLGGEHGLLREPHGERRPAPPRSRPAPAPRRASRPPAPRWLTIPSSCASRCLDAPAGEHQLHRALLAHHAREPLRSAAAGDDPEQDLRLAELRRSRTPRSCRTPARARSRRRARIRTRPPRAACGSPPAAARSARRAR